jgi:hypothetical protein
VFRISVADLPHRDNGVELSRVPIVPDHGSNIEPSLQSKLHNLDTGSAICADDHEHGLPPYLG